MAAIAKFISYDGGIAFSERVMKIQEADQEAVTIPLDDVTAVRVRRPQDDAEGFIRVDTADGKRYRIYFDDDQLQEAVRFKKQFDATVSDSEDDYALEPVQQKQIINRDSHKERGSSGAPALKCPNCGSTNVTVQMMQIAGKTKKHGTGLGGNINNAARGMTAMMTFGMSNLVWKKSKGTEQVKYTNQKVCLCQNCGNSWNIK